MSTPETPLSDADHTLGQLTGLGESWRADKNPVRQEDGRSLLAMLGVPVDIPMAEALSGPVPPVPVAASPDPDQEPSSGEATAPWPPPWFSSIRSEPPRGPVTEQAVDASLAAIPAYQKQARETVWSVPSRGCVRAILEAAAGLIVAAERERLTGLASDLALNYPEHVFPADGTSRDAISGTASRRAYSYVARRIREGWDDDA